MIALVQSRWLLGLTLVALLTAGPASAATLDVYTFDEKGHGSVTFADGRVMPLVSLIDFDPDPFLNGVKTLSYQLDNVPIITEGFVLLHESTDSCFREICSDVLHFSRVTNSVFFYSDQEPVDPSDLADNAAALLLAVAEGIRTPNTVFISEAGAEGANGADYTALRGDPGSGFALDVSYKIISDGVLVPTPSSLILLATGAALVAITRRRRRHK